MAVVDLLLFDRPILHEPDWKDYHSRPDVFVSNYFL